MEEAIQAQLKCMATIGPQDGSEHDTAERTSHYKSSVPREVFHV